MGKRHHLTILSASSPLREGKFIYRGESERKELPMGPPNHRDDGIEQLVADFQNGYLTRRGFLAKAAAFGLTAAMAASLLGAPRIQDTALAQEDSHPKVEPKKWKKGKGWGWVWGDDDQLGNINELSPELTKKALSMVKEGKVHDLGLTYERRSYKFAGHSPGEIISYRTPPGMLNQGDQDAVMSEKENSLNTTYTSNALFISDNVATQIDGFGHFYEGNPPHTYNGFRYEDIQSDWGLLKLGVHRIPPIVAPATMIDVAASVGKDPLPESFGIGPDHLKEALDKQGVDIDPLDVVLVRTGTGGVWLKGDGVGANEEEIAGPDLAGLTLSGVKWLVEEKGALALGSDTSALEVRPPKEQLDDGTSFNPAHAYLLVRQGVHILEFHNLENLAEDKAYKFAYVLGVNKIQGTAAGTVLRPVGLV
jgi:kynurenine formamidase